MRIYTEEEIRSLVHNNELWDWDVDALYSLRRMAHSKEMIQAVTEAIVSANHRDEGYAGIL